MTPLPARRCQIALAGGADAAFEEARRLHADARTIAEACARAPSPFLPTYLDDAWPGDNVVCIAAFHAHDEVLPPAFTATIEAWLRAARTTKDPATNM